MSRTNELRRELLYERYEADYAYLRRIGFKVQTGHLEDPDNILQKAYSKTELMELFGWKGLIGELQFRLLKRRRFDINYYLSVRLRKYKGIFFWETLDRVG